MTWFLQHVFPYTWEIFAWTGFVVPVLLFPAMIPKRTRQVAAVFIYLSSYIFGFECWLASVGMCYVIGGWALVVVGLIIGGIGVIPLAVLACAFTARWQPFGMLLGMAALTVFVRKWPKIIARLAHGDSAARLPSPEP